MLTLLFLLLLVLTTSLTALANSSLARHSPDFRLKIHTYSDIWTQQEVSILTEVLGSLRKYGLARVSELTSVREDILSRLVDKLRFIDAGLQLVVKSVLGMTKDFPESLLLRIDNVTLLSSNVSRLVKVVNNLYGNGELSSVDYLVVLGYIANEFKMEYVEDSETLANIGRAVEDVSRVLSKSVLSPLPEPDRLAGFPRIALFIKAREVPRPVLAAIALALLTPLAVQISYSLISRSRHTEFTHRILRISGTVVSSFTSPEDIVSAYWVAVGILSKVAPVNPWETHREYMTRLNREIKNKEVLSVFRLLTEEYEKVRFAGERGTLSREQLVKLVLSIEKEVSGKLHL